MSNSARWGMMRPIRASSVPKHGYRFIAANCAQALIAPRAQGSHVAGACTLAGLASGVVAGLIYGMIAATGGGMQVLILAAIIGALGLLAGAGLGAGMAAALAWRARADGWVVAGTTVGGLALGATCSAAKAWGCFRACR